MKWPYVGIYVDSWPCCFIRVLEGERLEDQGQGGPGGPMGTGMNFVLHMKDHKTVAIKKRHKTTKL